MSIVYPLKNHYLTVNTILTIVLSLSACSSHVNEKPNPAVRTLKVSFVGNEAGNEADKVTNAETDKTNISDSWEGYNRGVLRFNAALGKAVTKPPAKAYNSCYPN